MQWATPQETLYESMPNCLHIQHSRSSFWQSLLLLMFRLLQASGVLRLHIPYQSEYPLHPIKNKRFPGLARLCLPADATYRFSLLQFRRRLPRRPAFGALQSSLDDSFSFTFFLLIFVLALALAVLHWDLVTG